MSSFTLLYTQNIRGQLALLPRLATHIQRLRGKIDGRVWLMDAGASCTPEQDICRLTDGRAVLIVLDAIGYRAANVSGYLSAAGREKLKANYLDMALVDAEYPYVNDGIAYADAPPNARPHDLHIALASGDQTTISPQPTLGTIHTLTLQTLEAGAVGQITLMIKANATPQIASTQVYPLPAGTPPNATIAGAVDFVREEAAYFQRRRGSG